MNGWIESIVGVFYAWGAATGCPTSSDLERGVVFEKGPLTHVQRFYHQKIGQDVFWQGWTAPTIKDPWERTSFRGLLLQTSNRKSGAQARTDEYKEDLKSLFPLRPGDKHKITGQRKADGKTWILEVGVSILSEEDYNIGECTYKIVNIEFDIKTTLPNGKISKDLLRTKYSEELSFLVESGYTRFRYTNVRISRSGDWFPKMTDIED